MRRHALILSALALGACATTRVPPQLAEPTQHVRPVERGTSVDASAVTVRDIPRKIVPPCETERKSALVGRDAPKARFAECLLRNGEPKRAASVVAAYLPHRADLILRADLQHGEGVSDGADETTLNALVSASPDDPWVWAALAREYERQGRHAEANDALLKAKAVEAGDL